MRPCWLSLFLAASALFAADPFPSITGENLLGAKISLPEAAKGQPTVIVTGFSHASQSQMKVWSDRLEGDMKVFSVAMLEAVPRLVRPMVTGGIKGGVPARQKDHYLLLFKGEKAMKAAFEFSAADDAYVALLDADGNIRWRFHGAYSEDAYKELKSQLAALGATN